MKTKKILLAAMMIPVLPFIGCQNKQAETSPILSGEAKALLANMKQTSRKGYMFGHHDSSVYGIGWENEDGRSDIKSVCGDFPAIISFDLGHIEHQAQANLDQVSFDKIRQEIIAHYNRGGVISISWHVDNPLTGGDSWDVHDSTVVASILKGGPNHEKFQGWLNNLAEYLTTLQTADGVKIPVIFRPWHEHTGSWFWWGQDLCSTDEYKQLWTMTKERMDHYQLNNLIYAYSPGGDAADYMERYPGDELIDLLGFDTYQYDVDCGKEIYKSTIKKNLQYLDEYCKTNDKVYAITETGYEAVADSAWWTDMLQETIGEYEPAYVLVWRNAREKENHYFAPYPGQLSEANFVDFYKSDKTLFLQDVQDMYQYQ